MSEKLNGYIDNIEIKDDSLKNINPNITESASNAYAINPGSDAGQVFGGFGVGSEKQDPICPNPYKELWNQGQEQLENQEQEAVNSDNSVYKKFELEGEIDPSIYVNSNLGLFGKTSQNVENRSKELPTLVGFWDKLKQLLNTELVWEKSIVIELTPFQQKIEDDINQFLNRPINFSGIWDKLHNIFFKEIKLFKKDNTKNG